MKPGNQPQGNTWGHGAKLQDDVVLADERRLIDPLICDGVFLFARLYG